MQKGFEPIAQAFLRQFIGKAPARKRSNPDAALFAACDVLRQVMAELDACPGDTVDEVVDALAARESDAALVVATTPAMTHAGLQVQAELLLANMISTQEPAVRSFLAGLSGGSPARLSSNPDAVYIALCEEILATWTKYDQASAADDEQSTSAAYDKAQNAFDQLMAMPLPVTAAGRQAAARVALVHTSSAASHEPIDIEMPHVGDRLAWLLVGQLAGREEAVALGLARSNQP